MKRIMIIICILLVLTTSAMAYIDGTYIQEIYNDKLLGINPELVTYDFVTRDDIKEAIYVAKEGEYIELIETKVEWGRAESLYRIINPTENDFTATQLNSLTAQFDELDGNLLDWWFEREVIIAVDISKPIYRYYTEEIDIGCSEINNSYCVSDIVTVEHRDIIGFDEETEFEKKWVKIDNFNDITLENDKTFEFKVVGTFDMDDGHVAIYTIPEFMGDQYRQYNWWNASWPYRIDVSLTDHNSTIRDSEFVHIFIDFTEERPNNCSKEIRILNESGDLLPVWDVVEEVYSDGECQSANLTFYIDTYSANATRKLSIYFGNTDATSPIDDFESLVNLTDIDSNIFIRTGDFQSTLDSTVDGKGRATFQSQLDWIDYNGSDIRWLTHRAQPFAYGKYTIKNGYYSGIANVICSIDKLFKTHGIITCQQSSTISDRVTYPETIVVYSDARFQGIPYDRDLNYSFDTNPDTKDYIDCIGNDGSTDCSWSTATATGETFSLGIKKYIFTWDASYDRTQYGINWMFSPATTQTQATIFNRDYHDYGAVDYGCSKAEYGNCQEGFAQLPSDAHIYYGWLKPEADTDTSCRISVENQRMSILEPLTQTVGEAMVNFENYNESDSIFPDDIISDFLEFGSALIRGGFAQVVSTTSETSTSEIAISFETATRLDSDYYSYSSEELNILEAGWYKMNYAIAYDQDATDREVRRGWVEYCNGTEVTPSASYCYMRGLTYAKHCTTSATFIQQFDANSCIELHTECVQGVCDSDTVAGATWLMIEKI